MGEIMSGMLVVSDDGTFRRVAIADGPVPLETMQALVDGYIEAVYGPDFDVIINEESALFKRFRPNPNISRLLADHHNPGYSILGPALIVARKGDNSVPLPDDLLEQLSNELRGIGCAEATAEA